MFTGCKKSPSPLLLLNPTANPAAPFQLLLPGQDKVTKVIWRDSSKFYIGAFRLSSPVNFWKIFVNKQKPKGGRHTGVGRPGPVSSKAILSSSLKSKTNPNLKWHSLPNLREWWRKIFRTERRCGARGVFTERLERPAFKETPASTQEEEVRTKLAAITAFMFDQPGKNNFSMLNSETDLCQHKAH